MIHDITHKELLGTFGVDSGQVLITDPCYLHSWVDREFVPGTRDDSYSYSGACSTSLNERGGGTIGIGHDGVVSMTATGDGVYRVYKCFNGDEFVGLYIDLQY